jgi:hypothetical protein
MFFLIVFPTTYNSIISMFFKHALLPMILTSSNAPFNALGFSCLHDMVRLHIMVFMFFFSFHFVFIFFSLFYSIYMFSCLCVWFYILNIFVLYVYVYLIHIVMFMCLCLCYHLFLVIFKLAISMRGNDIGRIISTKHARKAISTFDMVCQCISRYRTCSKKIRDPCL